MIADSLSPDKPIQSESKMRYKKSVLQWNMAEDIWFLSLPPRGAGVSNRNANKFSSSLHEWYKNKNFYQRIGPKFYCQQYKLGFSEESGEERHARHALHVRAWSEGSIKTITVLFTCKM